MLKSINRPVFDMIRSMAVVMVFLIHFLGYRNIPVPDFVFNFFTHCSYGVSLFFAMSGYLIMQSLENSKDTKEYFVKRVSKLIPTYYFILIFGIIVWDIIFKQMPQDSFLHLGWLRYFLFLNVIVPSADYYYWNDLWGLWTMSCFMLFYLVAPIIKKYVKSYKAALIMLVSGILFCYIAKAVIFRVFSQFGLPDMEVFAGDSAVFNLMYFLTGTVAWYAVKDGKENNYLRVVIIFLSVFLLIRTDSYNRMIWSLLTVGFMISMKDFAYSKRFEWIGKALSVFGSYSFTIYLVHMPVLDLLQYFSEHVYFLGFLPFTVLTVVLTGTISVCINKLIERPFLKLLRKGSMKK